MKTLNEKQKLTEKSVVDWTVSDLVFSFHYYFYEIERIM